MANRIRNSRWCVRRIAPSEIEYKSFRFLITDTPTESTVANLIDELKTRNAKDLVRVCTPSYEIGPLEVEGIRVYDWAFDDGTAPPKQVINSWLELVFRRTQEDPSCCIAVHCVAGLGRAPVLVALALMELGMNYEDAVEMIRQKRRGAINSKQLTFLEKYRAKSRLKIKRCKLCIIL